MPVSGTPRPTSQPFRASSMRCLKAGTKSRACAGSCAATRRSSAPTLGTRTRKSVGSPGRSTRLPRMPRSPARSAPRGLRGPRATASQALRGPRATRASRGHRVSRGFRVLPAPRGLRARTGSVSPDQQANAGRQVSQGWSVCRVCRVPRAIPGGTACAVPPASLVPSGQGASPASLFLAQWGPWGRPVQRALLARRALQAQLAPLAPRGRWALSGPQA
mmetsp:Transcript_191/g.412  ORF Transcript_191/g.412 Transcript_191/m.412 type:complete len:219 (-) Transcript_191:1512-2168(-)